MISMKIFTLLSLSVILAPHPVDSADYCDTQLCGPNQTHIGCNNNDAFGEACTTPRHSVHIKGVLRRHVLKKHNEFRHHIAGGQVRNFTQAQRMATMIWSSELAQLALLNAKQCRIRYDCHNTARFPRSGQNIFLAATKASIDAERFVQLALDTWHRQGELSNQAHIALNDDRQRAVATHSFVNLVLAGNDHVGCAAVAFRRGAMNNFLFVCNYARKMVPHQAIYVSGQKAASGCKQGVNAAYTNLCTINEQF